MRILQVASLLAGFAGDSNQILLIAKALQKRGHEVAIATTDGDYFYFDKEKSKKYSFIRKKLANANGKTEVLGIPIFVAHCVIPQMALYCSDATKLAKKIIKNFDVIHICNWYHHLGMVFSNIAYENRIPFVVSAWGSLQSTARDLKRNQKWIIDQMYTKKMIKHAAGFHSVGEQETDTYLALGINPKKIFKIDHGIILENFKIKKRSDILQKNGIDVSNNKYILYMSRIDRKKGLEFLLQAFERIANNYKNLFLVIAGSGDENYKNGIKQQAKNLGLENVVKFTGLVSNDERLELLESAQLFVLTSHSDVHPIAVQDALTMGIPVVITQACDYPEVDKYNVGVIVSQDRDSIANAISKLLSNEELLKKCSINTKKLIKDHFLLETKIDMYEKMFSFVTKK